MKFSLFLCFYLVFFASLKAQIDSETVKFIDQIFTNSQSNTKRYVRLCKNARGHYDMKRIGNNIAADDNPNDSLLLSDKERNLIIKDLANEKDGYWKNLKLKNVKLFSIVQYHHERKNSVNQDNYWFLSQPVFIRNNTYAFIYQENYWGALRGEGYLMIYKKTTGRWLPFSHILFWIS